jgi:NAD(P)-dependent dehydrogenase (short-subunit alcohol dehydrogenase family)
VPADSSDMTELDRLAAEVAKTTDRVDILFANAGATWGEKFDTHPEKMFSKVMDLNVKSVFYTIQKYVKHLNGDGSPSNWADSHPFSQPKPQSPIHPA